LEEKYPNVSKVLNIGLTYEKHTITGIKVFKNKLKKIFHEIQRPENLFISLT